MIDRAQIPVNLTGINRRNTMATDTTQDRMEDACALEALQKALKELNGTIQLGKVGTVTKAEAEEILSYQRTWAHPLGIVIDS